MLYVWILLLLATCGGADSFAEGSATDSSGTLTLPVHNETERTDPPVITPVITVRPSPRTLDRQAAELAWKSWLQSAESRDPGAPPRRITTKSLFITPPVCPKGPKLDRDGCIQIVNVNKEEHERYFLEQLNALFTSSPNDEIYEYGDEESDPLQLKIPISSEPLTASLNGQDSTIQTQDYQPEIVNIDKKQENFYSAEDGVKAELELLTMQFKNNETLAPNKTSPLGHNYLQNFLPFPDKPKRDSNTNESLSESTTTIDEGQKEEIFGNVGVDPVVYLTEYQNQQAHIATLPKTVITVDNSAASVATTETPLIENEPILAHNTTNNTTDLNDLQTDIDKSTLNPENDYSDIGEAIKLISRYAEVTTDDNFMKDQKKNFANDNILGTRTRLQNRRNKPKADLVPPFSRDPSEPKLKENLSMSFYPKTDNYYRYPWTGQHTAPPPDYPFRHLQDYWPGRGQNGGVYAPQNPRRHHHHNLRPRGYADLYQGIQMPPQRAMQRRLPPPRYRNDNQDLYSLLGLRHWFSSQGAKR